jgi:dihydroorotate dehydrogenase
MSLARTLDIDTTIEQLGPDQLAELGQRLYEVAPEAENSAPVSRVRIDELGEIEEPDQQQRAEMTALAAWIGASHGLLTAAYPGPTPPFDHLSGFWSNFFNGPQNGDPFPRGPFPELPTKVLDFELSFPFGVPACALTPRSEYIDYFATRGFDLLTFKTVRDRPWDPHPFPQWGFAPGIASPLEAPQLSDPVYPTLDPGKVDDVRNASLVNSFGVPSVSVERWKMDVEESKRGLGSRQVLMVSVMGSPEQSRDDADLVDQFARTAAHAQEAGADIIEVNLSCPNTGGELICSDAEQSRRVIEAVHRETGGKTPIFIKISYLDPTALGELVAKCQSHIRGIVAINAVPVTVLKRSGVRFFPNRPNDKAGLSGAGIRRLGLSVARHLVELRKSHRASADDWIVVGVGGVSSPEDFRSYRDLGVDVVQSCSGAWLNHRLALEIRDRFGHGNKTRLWLGSVFREGLKGYRTGGVSLVTRPGRGGTQKRLDR